MSELQQLAQKYVSQAWEKGLIESTNMWFGTKIRTNEKVGCFLTFLLYGKSAEDYDKLKLEYNDPKYHVSVPSDAFYSEDSFFVERLPEFPEKWLRWGSRKHWQGVSIAEIIEKLPEFQK